MSLGVLATEGYTVLLDALLEGVVFYAHLFTNDVSADKARVTADFVEPIMVGYAPVVIRHWTPAMLRHEVAFAVSDPVIFKWTSGPDSLPVRGYYVTSGSAGKTLWTWRRPGDPFALGSAEPVLMIYVKATFPPPVDDE